MSNKRTILVTAALPYANGPIHIGHMVEYLQADIWARFQRMRGNDAIYLCADDAHGTPIMLRAREEGVEAKDLVDSMQKSHLKDFEDFHIQFDTYHSTHSKENEELCGEMYLKLKNRD